MTVTPYLCICVVLCGMLRPVGSLEVAWIDRYLQMHRCMDSTIDHDRALGSKRGSLALRLRGGLCTERQAPGLEERIETATTDNSLAGTACLPVPCDGERRGKVGERGAGTDTLPPNSATRQIQTATCLEMATLEAIAQRRAVYWPGGPGAVPRYAWDSKKHAWMIFKRTDEDLSIESLRTKWELVLDLTNIKVAIC